MPKQKEFVRVLCEEKGVSLHVFLTNVPAMAKMQGVSLEKAEEMSGTIALHR